jgi:RimJ/RimL family protein N-acetyltransferase
MQWPHRQPIEVPKEIRTERLVLRPQRKADAAAIFAAIDESRHHLSQWLVWVPEVQSVEDMVPSCETAEFDWARGADFRVAITDAETGAYLGHCGLHYPDWGVRAFEIGYWLRESAVGHGYMTEAVGGLTRYAFETLRARRVEIRCDPNNVRSRRVAERNGYVLEGRLRNARLTPDEHLRDTLVYGMIEGDFASHAWAESIANTCPVLSQETGQ